MLPSIISFLLSWRRFSFTAVVRGVEANKNKCSDFENVENLGYPCLTSGITALSVILAIITLGISLITISHLSGIPGFATGGTWGGALVIFIGFLYLQEYDSDVFKLSSDLPNSSNKFIRLIGKNPSLSSNVLCMFGLLAYQSFIMFFLG